MEQVKEIREELTESKCTEEVVGEDAEGIGKGTLSEKESGIKKLLNKNKNATQYSVAFLLLMLFCSAPLFAGLVNREMYLNEEIFYSAYKYNTCFMYISNTIYTLILIYVLGRFMVRAENRSLPGAFRKAYKREPWLLFWTALLLWSLIPTFNAVDVVGAFIGATELSSGYITYLFSLSLMVCVYWLNEQERDVLIKYFVVVSDILALIMLGFEYNIPIFKDFTVPVTGVSVFTNQNHYGYYLTVAIMCMTGLYFSSLEAKRNGEKSSRAWRITYLVSSMVNMYSLVLNDTLGAYFAVLFGTIFLMIVWRARFGKMNAWYWIPIAFFVTLTVLSYFDLITSKAGTTIGHSLVVFVADLLKLKHKSEGYELGGSRRIKIWKETIARIKEHPILGYGPDMIFDAEGNALMETTPHNEFLECAFFLGIPGLVLYLGGLIKLFIDRCKGLKALSCYQIVAAGAVFGYLASSFFGVRKYHTSPYLYMFLGLLLLKNGQEAVKNKKS